MTGRFRRYAGAWISALAILFCTSCGMAAGGWSPDEGTAAPADTVLAEVPEYDGAPYVEVEGNQPDFTEEELQVQSYESYGNLDELGRCTEAEACIGTDLMPTEERESISEVKPTGWHTVKYDSVDGSYLYNRCHLIGYQLTAENANEKNLITGTRYLNTEGMLPFENEVAEYVQETDNHVMYRVTPDFEGDNLLASGVYMEAESVEDEGEGISFSVYVYNVQPGIEIDYTEGGSRKAEETGGGVPGLGQQASLEEPEDSSQDYVLNENTRKFHLPECGSVEDIKPKNRREYYGSRQELEEQGYEPCGRCLLTK